MNLAKLLEEEDGDKYQAILELNIRIAHKIENPDVNILQVLSPTELCILLICRINVYVCNGGYEHYFYYSGQYTNETRQAISKAGLTELFQNYTSALKVFENEYVPAKESERQALLDGFTENQKDTLDKLSDEYYGIYHLDDLFKYAYENQPDISV